MTLKEWLDFNEQYLNCDLLIVLLKNGSYKTDDIICKLYMDKGNAKDIFGKYELKQISTGTADYSDHRTIKVLLWKT